MHKSMGALAVLAMVIGQGSVEAAPDHGLGMALMSAMVNSDGTIARSSGVVSATSDGAGTGVYTVHFDRSVATCAYVANLADSAFGLAPAGYATLNLWPASANEIRVRTRKPDGTALDSQFALMVFCPQ